MSWDAKYHIYSSIKFIMFLFQKGGKEITFKLKKKKLNNVPHYYITSDQVKLTLGTNNSD